MSLELLFEIGTEELPPGEMKSASDALADFFVSKCKAARLTIGPVEAWYAPRRLALYVTDIDAFAETVEETLLGPTAAAAFDTAGKPTKAAEGFARGKGVGVEALFRQSTPKGEYVAVTIRREGLSAEALLTETLNEAFAKIPWKRAMRWGWSDVTFARPVHWIIALLGCKVLDVRFGGIAAGSSSRGHRFMAPGEITLTSPSDYREALRNAKVLVSQVERREKIADGVQRVCADRSLRGLVDDDLLDEVVNLVEWPVPLIGTFDEQLLEVPREVLVTSMAKHQRYFAADRQDGTLSNTFVFVANIEVPDPELVIRGNLRVLLARLEDAKFFYREDQKKSLDDRVEALTTIRYIDGLGSVLDRTNRIEVLAEQIARELFPDHVVATRRAAHLCKADLTTGMVYEFPNLQGVMGRYYAGNAGESPEVCAAIEQHYQPRSAADRCPETPAGIAVGIAEKIDTIVGCFALGLIPSGSADPYGLRRSALGILRTAMDRDVSLPLRELCERAYSLLPSEKLRPASEVVTMAMEFIENRLRAFLANDFPTDITDAVVAVIGDQIPTASARCRVLQEMRRSADFLPLASGFKRVMNLVKRADNDTLAVVDGESLGRVVSAQLEIEDEIALYHQLTVLSPRVSAAIHGRQFEQAGELLIGLKPLIDRFFDNVTVNSDDLALRANRYALLAAVLDMFREFADMSKIQAPIEA